MNQKVLWVFVLEKPHSLEVNPFAIDGYFVMMVLGMHGLLQGSLYLCTYCCLFTFVPPQTFI